MRSRLVCLGLSAVFLILPMLGLFAGNASAAAITREGVVSATWDTLTANWIGDATVYTDGDDVTFDDTSANTNSVSLVGTLQPGSVLVNAARDYTFAGTGLLGGTTGIAKSGTGSLTISNANTFSGVVNINEGIVRLGNAASLGSTVGGTVVNGGTTLSPGGTLDLFGTKTLDEQITVQGVGVDGKGVLINTVSGTPVVNNLVLAGDATFGGSERVDIRGTPSFGNYTLTVDHTAVTTGNNNGVRITGSPTILSHDLKNANVVQGTLAFHNATMGQAGGTVTVTHNPNTANVTTLQIMRTIDYNTNWTLEKNLVFTGGRIHDWRGWYTLAGTMALNANEAVTQTEINVADYNTTYKTSISISSLITGTGGITKTGVGRLYLLGDNTYSGDTIVSAGTLFLGDSGSISDSPVIDVQTNATFNVSAVTGGFTLVDGQTLMGNGTVTGGVLAADGSLIEPGASIGTLTVNGNLELGGTLLVEYDGATIDKLVVNGDLDLGDGAFAFSPFGAALTEESYVFATFTGTRTGTAAAVAPTGYAVAYDDDAKTVSLVVAPIPEPSSFALLFLGLIGLVAGRRRP